MISVEHLTKCYGDFTAVDDLSFEINEGHVYGFLGPNGAGKSTTMNIMTGCLSATSGRVRIDGYDIFEEPYKAKKLIGYLPEHPPLYMSETPMEYLKFVGEAKGLRGEELKKQIDEVIEKTKLTEVKNRRISALSKGYRQRVGIAQALLGNPKVIILDEPTVGLDPIQIIEIRDLIKELGKSHTVIFSSHILSEVQAICDQILIISKGKLIAFGETAKLEEMMRAPNEIIITTNANQEETKKLLEPINQITEISFADEKGEYTVAHIKTNHDKIYDISGAIFSAFAAKDKLLLEMTVKKANLEDIFIELTEKGGKDNEASDTDTDNDNERTESEEAEK
ncbi:MAG: ABC transporter ATP-binding protein [Clostridiales bacterium]|nr:ABC transporter ATP-binding protein [Clostridiales bacterium]